MNEFAKTGAYVGAAAVLVLGAWLAQPRSVGNEHYSDEGTEFFPAFTDPREAAELEVQKFDRGSTSVVKFNVKQNDKGLWTIPSHNDYPADATTRMARAASMLIGLRREKLVSYEKQDHAARGVLDPLDQSLETKGRGTRVTFKDKNGNVLADLIIGDEVEGKIDQHYVRLPDKKATYSVKLRVELSTKFEDWIERDLLKTSSYDLAKLTFDNYSVDERQGRIVEGEKFTLSKDEQQKWTLDGLGTSETTKEDKAREIVDTLTALKIVGVRQKPPGITAELRAATGFDRMAIESFLQRYGYFVGQKEQLISNEGDLIARSKKGVVYTLKFGEIAPGEGLELTAGVDDGKAKAKEPDKKDEIGPQPAATGNHRYLMITAAFDDSLLQKPDKPRLTDEQLQKRRDARSQIEQLVKAVDTWKGKHEGKLPASLQQLTEGDDAPLKELKKDPWDNDYVLAVDGDKFTVQSLGEDKAAGGEGAAADVSNDKFAFEDELSRAASDWKAYDDKVKEGRKAADDLTKRFGPWFYVIDSEAYGKLKPARKDLVEEKPAEPAKSGEAGTTPPGGDGKDGKDAKEEPGK